MQIVLKMSAANVLMCIFVLYNFASVKTLKKCNDCVSVTSCQNALDLASTSRDELTTQLFRKSMCGYDGEYPKVCCSDFTATVDEIINHKNINMLPNDCGDIDGNRIIGGRVAKLYEFPWMALISYFYHLGIDFQCSGSIINERYILTAAHCVQPTKKIAGIRIGEYDISAKVDCQGIGTGLTVCETKLQDIPYEEIKIHPNYTGQHPLQYDIALIRLQNPIDLSYNNAAPVCLPVTKELRDVVLAGKNATITGWGLTEDHVESNILIKVDIPVQTGDTCRQHYNRNPAPGDDITDKTFCAGEYKKDSCSGDSGGPLIIQSEYNGVYRYVQYGIISYGPKKCGSEHPGLYTDVSKFMKWILDNMRP